MRVVHGCIGEDVGSHRWSSPMRNLGWFTRAAKAASRFTGRPLCFMLAVAVVLAWIISGPLFGFSDTWQLVINTGTTIITFLMVFLIQNTQNRDTEAMQIKLDELIRATQGANNRLLDLEELEDRELEAFRSRYESLAETARSCGADDERSRGTPELSPPPQPPSG
jgi:low affinity Fe/Cu permease